MEDDNPARITARHSPHKPAFRQRRRTLQRPEKIIYCEVNIEKDKCKGCQLCIINCPVKHLRLSSDLNKRGVKYVHIDRTARCSGCGFCFFVCPETCIEVYEKVTSNPK